MQIDVFTSKNAHELPFTCIPGLRAKCKGL